MHIKVIKKYLRNMAALIKMKQLPLLIVFVGLIAALGIVFLPTTSNSSTVTYSAECKDGDADNFDCWASRYESMTRTMPVAEVYADLKRVYAENTYVQSQCHQITHVIGRIAAQLSNTVGEAYKNGDGFCWSGYYHGVIEQVAKKMGEGAFIEQLNTLCADVEAESRYSFYHYNCVHGLGHGVMSISDNELFDSLDSCNTIIDEWNRLSCFGGVFMENVMSDPVTNPTHSTKYLDPTKPMYPCTDVERQFKEQCYLMQTSYALRQVNYSFAAVFDMCAAVETEFQVTCYRSLGRDASGNSVSNVASTKANCELGRTIEQRTECAIGAVKDFISYHSNDVKARELCRSFSDISVQSVCDATATDYLRSF